MVSKFLKKYWLDILFLIIILSLSPLFLYKLGQSSLVSWDEAWYAAIANNIVKSGDFLKLTFNGKPFFDHPAAGFWWMAISFKILGVTNFAARFPSAIFGILTLIFVFFLGKELFNKWVGFASAVALTSAPWFLYRARSGDLDIFLTFFFVLSIFYAVKSVHNRRLFIPLGISLLLLFLTKTIVPFTIIPALIVIYLGTSVQLVDLFTTFLVFFFPAGIWYRAQISVDPNFIQRYLFIGLPGVSVKTSYLANFQIFKNYLHAGIGKWFWPGVASVIASLLAGKRAFWILSVFCLSFAAPFIFSSRTQIWHLVPLYPFMILSFFGFFYFVIDKIVKNKYVAPVAILAVCFYFTFTLVKGEWNQFINIPAYISDEEILSREAAKYPDPFYIDGDFGPAAVFYSGKTVQQTYTNVIAQIFKEKNNFLLIATQNRISDEGIKPSQYVIIKKDRDKLLIRKI